MLLTPEMCRAARALLNWEVDELAAAAELATATVRRFEAGGVVEPRTVEALLQALDSAGIELIAAGAKSLDGGPGVRTRPMPEPEVTVAAEALLVEESGPRLVIPPA